MEGKISKRSKVRERKGRTGIEKKQERERAVIRRMNMQLQCHPAHRFNHFNIVMVT